jgi:NitT/TauT family transport system substrate-binding protein
LDKKTGYIVAVAVVAIVVVAAVAAYYYWPQTPSEQKTVYWIGIPPNQQQAALQDGSVDGAVSWEPYVSDSIVAEDGHVLLWSGDVWPHHPCCVVAVKTSYLSDNPDLVARMVRAHIEADLWIIDALNHPESANYTLLMDMGSVFSGRSVEVVQEAVQHIEYSFELTPEVVDWFGNFTQMFIDLDQASLGSYPSVDAFINDLVNDSVIGAALAVQPSNEILGTVNLGYLAGDLHQFARVVAMNATVGGGKTLYEKFGLNIVATNPAGYLNGGAVMDAFAAGVIDVGYLGVPPAILKKLNVGTDIKVVALANSEGSAIIAKAGINSFEELEGKVVATPGPSSIQHLLLLWYANTQGFAVKLQGT